MTLRKASKARPHADETAESPPSKKPKVSEDVASASHAPVPKSILKRPAARTVRAGGSSKRLAAADAEAKPAKAKAKASPKAKSKAAAKASPKAKGKAKAKAKANAKAKAKAKAKSSKSPKASRGERGGGQIEVDPEWADVLVQEFYIDPDTGVVLGCSSCRFAWYGCTACKSPSFRGKRRSQITYRMLAECKQNFGKITKNGAKKQRQAASRSEEYVDETSSPEECEEENEYSEDEYADE